MSDTLYATLSDLHTFLNVDPSDTTNDTAMQMALDAAASAIDRATNRTFVPQDTVATTRYYTLAKDNRERWLMLPNGLWTTYFPFYDAWPFFFTAPDHRVVVDDIFLTNQLITDIVVKDHDTQAVITLDRLWPFNAAAVGKPFTEIWFDPSVVLNRKLGGIDITAKYGWVSVPTTIKMATLLQAETYLKMKDFPTGLATGADQMGNSVRILSKLNPTVTNMIADYRRWWGAV